MCWQSYAVAFSLQVPSYLVQDFTKLLFFLVFLNMMVFFKHHLYLEGLKLGIIQAAETRLIRSVMTLISESSNNIYLAKAVAKESLVS